MDKLYLIEGNNDILIQKEIDKIINNIKEKVDVYKFDLENTNINKIIETLDTYDLFLNKKVVICNALFLEEKMDDLNLDDFIKYINNPSDNILILIAKKVNNRLKITGLINKYFKKITIKDLNLVSFVKENINGYKMDNQVINYFLSKTSHDYSFIKSELDKLISYKIDDKVILKEDIDLITTKSIEASIFDLIDSIIKKDKVKTYEYYNYFINNGTEVYQILVMLSNQIRLIYNVLVLRNLSDYEISNKLGVKEYPVKLARIKGYSYSKSELLNLLYNLSIIDEDIKTGKQIASISFLTFIMQM